MIDSDSSGVFKVVLPDCYRTSQVPLFPSAELYCQRVKYDRAMALYDGRHTELFNDLPGEDAKSFLAGLSSLTEEEERWRNAAYMSLALPELGCVQKADLQFREFPLIVTGEENSQIAVDRMFEDSQLGLALYKLATTAWPCKGDAALKLHIPRDQRVRITSVPMESIEWERDRYNCEEYKAASFNMILPTPRGPMLWRERHIGAAVVDGELQTGRVENRTYNVKETDKDSGIYAILSEETNLSIAFPDEDDRPQASYETYVDVPTLFKLPNREIDGRFYGDPDFGIISFQLMRAIMALLSDTYKHVIQKIFGGIIVLSQEAEGLVNRGPIGARSGSTGYLRGLASASGYAGQATISRNSLGAQFENQQTSGITRYVNVEASFDAPMRLCEQLVRQFAFQHAIDISGLYDNASTQGLSGRALQLRMAPVLSRVARKNAFLRTRLEKILLYAQTFEMAHRKAQIKRGVKPIDLPDEYAPILPTVTIQDGLPRDEEAEARIASVRIANGTRAKLTAIKRMDDTDDEGAADELKLIQDEKLAEFMLEAKAREVGTGLMAKYPVGGESDSGDMPDMSGGGDKSGDSHDADEMMAEEYPPEDAA